MSTAPTVRLPPVDELRAGELVLRPWRPEDVPVLQSLVLRNLEHLRPWMPWVAAEPARIEDRYALVHRWDELVREGTDWICGVFVQGEAAGSSGLHQRRGPGVLEIGYWLDQGFVGRGIASATAHLLTTFAFESPDTAAVEIWHDRANARSRAVPRRLGYELAAEVPADEPLAPGEEGVNCIWRMTRSRWQEQQHRFDPTVLPAA